MDNFQKIRAEMLVHPAAFCLRQPKKALVIGSELNSITREILRHSRIETCIRVKPDELLTLNETTHRSFDLVVQETLMTDLSLNWIEAIQSRLSPEGIWILPTGNPYVELEFQVDHVQKIRPYFKKLWMYSYSTPGAQGGLQSVIFSSNTIHPIDDLSRSGVTASGLEFDYYNLGIHESAFFLPEFQRKALFALLNPI